jgi:hypothetical protein
VSGGGSIVIAVVGAICTLGDSVGHKLNCRIAELNNGGSGERRCPSASRMFSALVLGHDACGRVEMGRIGFFRSGRRYPSEGGEAGRPVNAD